MSARKSERLLNLLIGLLVSRTYLSKAQIRGMIEPYREASDEAFEKMFERDKDELRALGIPIEIGSYDPLFEDAVGYRIPRDTYELPEVTFTPDEAAVVGIATRVWQHAGLAATTGDAVRKLAAAGVETDVASLQIAQPQITATEPSFETLWQATLDRTPVAFDYRTSAGSRVERRHLEPWGLALVRGRWYCAGHDRDRGEQRVFRLSRVIGDVQVDGAPSTFDVPADFDIREAMSVVDPAPERRRASVRLRAGRANALRARARSVTPQGEWDAAEIEFDRTSSFVDEILGFGPDVVVDSPEDVRQAVVTRLEELAR